MMVEFVHAMPMSLVLNVILVKLVGLVSHLVKVRCIIILYLNSFIIIEKKLQNASVTSMVPWIQTILLAQLMTHVNVIQMAFVPVTLGIWLIGAMNVS